MNNKILLIIVLFSLSLIGWSGMSYAQLCPACGCDRCEGQVTLCSTQCGQCSILQEPDTNQHFTDELTNHRLWMVNVFFLDNVAGTKPGLLAAMMLMAEQLTVNAMQQVEIIGTFFDAKHQLETQRLFQTLTAQAHKDYQPSQELCNVGTVARPLVASERKTHLVSTALAKRAVDRQLLSKNTIEMENGVGTDRRSRLVQFIQNYCNPSDNAYNLDLLCQKGSADAANFNKDIDYTTTIDLPLTLDIDFSVPAVTEDERAVFALNANLIAHESMPNVPADTFNAIDGNTSYEAAMLAYIDSRSLVAKRSVASNSLAAIAALKASGSPEGQPFIYSLIQELSPDNITIAHIQDLIGENPSYYAQMEILTKKLYQNPKFYSDLYDKPANVLRKDVAIQAADLMQKRDIYRSLLRSEAVLAVMLETALMAEQDKLTNELDKAIDAPPAANAAGLGG